MNADENEDVRRLVVELPVSEFELLEKAADREHRTLKGEVRRLIKRAYGKPASRESDAEQEQTTAAQAGAVLAAQ